MSILSKTFEDSYNQFETTGSTQRKKMAEKANEKLNEKASEKEVSFDATNKEKQTEAKVQDKDAKKAKSQSKSKELDEAKKIIAELEEKNETLEQEKLEIQELLLRKSADFENTRKRLLRDKEDSIRYANTQLLVDLIELMDNFERAITSGREAKDFDSFFSGVEMIEGQLFSMLESKYGLTRFESKGEDFDPQKHEAVTMLASEEERESQFVVEEFQKGYQLGDRVLRHSKVAVSKPTE